MNFRTTATPVAMLIPDSIAADVTITLSPLIINVSTPRNPMYTPVPAMMRESMTTKSSSPDGFERFMFGTSFDRYDT